MVRPDAISSTLGSLLARPDLRLRPLAVPDEALDRLVRWVHSSDLSDPTPFLADDLVLLTTGSQLARDDDDRAAEDYVRRLVSRGVIALGFGAEVVHAGAPAALVAACTAAGLALFEVPYRTPFLAVARANAEAVAAQAYARQSWALAAQRALSLAALRPDGLSATLAELARQLKTWVGLYDAAGVLAREFPPGALSDHTHELLAVEVAQVLRRGARAASALSLDESPFTLQTLGRGGHLRGVIAIASGELDQEGRSVLTSVIAMAGLALEQHQSLARARSALRTGLIEALTTGNLTLVRRVARSIGETVPTPPVRIALTEPRHEADAVTEWLELHAAEHAGSVFFGRAEAGLIVITPAGEDSLVRELASTFNLKIGQSDPVGYADFVAGVSQAATARERGAGGLTTFAEARQHGVLSTLTDESRLVAAAMLAPLRDHDLDAGADLMRTLRTFLEHDGSAEAAAAALGVHRHTVRSRIANAERVLGRSLRTFPERADVWAAFVASES